METTRQAKLPFRTPNFQIVSFFIFLSNDGMSEKYKQYEQSIDRQISALQLAIERIRTQISLYSKNQEETTELQKKITELEEQINTLQREKTRNATNALFDELKK